MIIPCIDLMDGKVVQLVQGREKVLEGKSLDEMLEMFSGFPQIQVIDLDAALGRGSNGDLVAYLACHAGIRAGGGVRTVERARKNSFIKALGASLLARPHSLPMAPTAHFSKAWPPPSAPSA